MLLISISLFRSQKSARTGTNLAVFFRQKKWKNDCWRSTRSSQISHSKCWNVGRYFASFPQAYLLRNFLGFAVSLFLLHHSSSPRCIIRWISSSWFFCIFEPTFNQQQCCIRRTYSGKLFSIWYVIPIRNPNIIVTASVDLFKRAALFLVKIMSVQNERIFFAAFLTPRISETMSL